MTINLKQIIEFASLVGSPTSSDFLVTQNMATSAVSNIPCTALGGGGGGSYSQQTLDDNYGMNYPHLAPDGTYDVTLFKNCDKTSGQSKEFDTIVNMSNGQTIKLIFIRAPGSNLGFNLPTYCYSSIAQSTLDSIWSSTTPPLGAIFEITKIDSTQDQNGKSAVFVYTTFENI